MSEFSDTPGPENNISSVSDATVQGIGWQSVSSIVQVTLALITQVLLSRLLTPADFGVVVYAMILVGFSAQLAQAGIVPALIQRRDLQANHLSAGFLISVLIGLLVWAILWVTSPVIVHIDEQITILRALSFIFLFNSATIVSDAVLQRHFLFRKLFWIDNISYGLGTGLVAIACAYRGYGAWSLVFGALAQSVARGFLLFAASPFKVSFQVRKKDILSLLNFGTGMTLARLANFAAGNSSQFVIGTLLGAISLGLFQRAYTLITTPLTRMVSVVTSVLFPALSRLQDDIQQLRKSYLFLITLTSVVMLPLATFISASSNEIILVLYGEQWAKAANSLAILSFNAAFISIFTLTDALARAKGQVYSQFRRHFAYAILALIGAVVGSRYGIEGVAVGFTGASFLMYLFNAQLALKITGAGWFEFFRAQKAGILLSFSMGAALVACDQITFVRLERNALFTLITKVLIASVAFLITAWFMPTAWYGNLIQRLVTYLAAKFPAVNWNMLARMEASKDA
jgi:PST family polysaccharide transporter